MRVPAVAVVLALASLSVPGAAQFSPFLGQWGKSHADDVRIMTWNVLDFLCATNPKVAGDNNWTAAARIVAALKPDVLILQEVGDNDGNGTGTGVDSVATLTTVAGLFLRGGNDPFRSNAPVTAYVQLFAPGYDLPYLAVGTVNDGFNRNLTLSRFPFADLNGDTRATMSDIPAITADLYSPGGNGGIRGYVVTEINLPNATYAHDLVVGNSHLKAGTGSSNHTQRTTAARNIAYFLDYFYGGGGSGVPDPRAKIADSPPASIVLPPGTVLVTGGDWNEDEATNGTAGPAQWIASAQTTDAGGGGDGPDRNRSDLVYGPPLDLFTASPATTPFGATYDHLAFTDSVAAARRSFVFNSATITIPAAMPASLLSFPGGAANTSARASDHYPVVLDLILPAPLACNTAASDLAFAKLGGNGRFPRFQVCGSLASGGTGIATLFDAPPNAQAFAVVSPATNFQLLLGATVIPAAPTVVGPFFTDPQGTLTLPLAGGAGPFDLYAQWALVDPGLPASLGFSNALALHFLP